MIEDLNFETKRKLYKKIKKAFKKILLNSVEKLKKL